MFSNGNNDTFVKRPLTLPYIKNSDKDEFEDVAVSELLHECPEGFAFFLYNGPHINTAFVYPAGETRVRFIVQNDQTKEQVSVIVDNTVSFGEINEEAQETASKWDEDPEL
jgi:hypothetical protein